MSESVNPLDLVGLYRALSKRESERFQRFEKLKPVIEMVRSGIPDDEVFLSEEFRARALLPLAESDSSFRSRYDAFRGLSFDLTLGMNTSLISPIQPNFYLAFQQPNNCQIPAEKLEEGCVKDRFIRDAETQLRNIHTGEGKNPPIDSATGYDWNDEPVTYGELKKRHVTARLADGELPAFRASDLLEYMIETGYEQYEDNAIRKGNGDKVLAFWQAVKNLEPYGHLFPKNHSNGGDNKRKREMLTQLEPALVPVFSA